MMQKPPFASLNVSLWDNCPIAGKDKNPRQTDNKRMANHQQHTQQATGNTQSKQPATTTNQH
jgi:hypothetical protein